MISEIFKNDKEFVLKTVKEDGKSLYYASEELKNDKEVVLEAVKEDGDSLEYASEEMKNDKEVVLEAVKQNGWSLRYASEEMKNDKEFILEAVKQNGRSLRYASEEMKNDKEVVLEAVKQNGIMSLRYASEEMKNDKEVVLEAVKQNGMSLRYASEELKNDKEVVLEAIKQNGWSLFNASEEMKNDKEVVLEAVKQNGTSLRYASEEMKNDKEVVLEAVKQNGNSLKYASVEIKNDVEFVMRCCMINRSAAEGIGNYLVNNSLLAEKIKKYGSDVERAFEEFERERMTSSEEVNICEGKLVELCFDLFKKKWEDSDYKLVEKGVPLEETLKQKGLELGSDLEDLNTKLRNEPSLFRRVQKWNNEVDNLKLDSSEKWGVFLSRFENTEETVNEFHYDSSQKKHFSDLQVFRLLGKGSFGRTYLCHIDGCFGLFVVKLYKETFFGTLSQEKGKEYLQRDSLQISSHKNVVPILFHSDSETIDLSKLPDFEEFWKDRIIGSETILRGGMLIMKYHQTTLSSVITNRLLMNLKEDREIFLPSEVILIVKGIFSGAFHLHQNHIVHRDIHSGNVFIHLRMGRVWIGDYGCSLDLRKNPSGFRVHKDHEILYSVSGSFREFNKTGGLKGSCIRSHCSPEILNFDRSKSDHLDYSKSDLYSCGVIGKELFDLVDEERKKENGDEKYWKECVQFSEFISSVLARFEDRISFDEAVKRMVEFEFKDIDDE